MLQCIINFIKSIKRFICFSGALNKTECILFSIFLVFNILFFLVKDWIPEAYAFMNPFIALIKNLNSSLTSGILFYLIVDTLRQRSETRNELERIISEYKEMKRDILRELLLAENDYIKPVDEKILDLDYQTLRKYFTQEVFIKALSNLGKREILSILSRIRNFLINFNPIRFKFVKKDNNHSLPNLYLLLKDIELNIELILLDKQDETWLAFDWCESASIKSVHPLYLLLFRGEHQDIYIEALTNILEEYS